MQSASATSKPSSNTLTPKTNAFLKTLRAPTTATRQRGEGRLGDVQPQPHARPWPRSQKHSDEHASRLVQTRYPVEREPETTPNYTFVSLSCVSLLMSNNRSRIGKQPCACTPVRYGGRDLWPVHPATNPCTVLRTEGIGSNPTTDELQTSTPCWLVQNQL